MLHNPASTGDPIKMFHEKIGFDADQIIRCEAGEKYTGVMLVTGNIGVCAILEQKIDRPLCQIRNPDPSNPGDRILLNAYYNALFNYAEDASGSGDIFDSARFTKYSSIVMIGGFESLLAKFRERGTEIKVFDRLSDAEFLIPMRRQPEMLASADCVILTGTTINNGTFNEIISHTPDGCDIFLLGPSNILHRDMFSYKNIKVVFGSRFRQGDEEVLDLIKKGHGTKGFLKNLNKVYISAPDYRL
jgi:uncharacterized protein (DUF4213/DUF364 family)